MWVRKTSQEIAEEADGKRSGLWRAFGGPAIVFCATFFFVAVAIIAGPRHNTGAVPYWPTTWGDLLRTAVLVASTAAVVAYLCQALFEKPIIELISPSDRDEICDTCHRVKLVDKQRSCECGGRFEDFTLWKWVDD